MIKFGQQAEKEEKRLLKENKRLNRNNYLYLIPI